MITLEQLKKYKIDISGDKYNIKKTTDGQYHILCNNAGVELKELSFMCLYEIVKHNCTFTTNNYSLKFKKIKKDVIYIEKSNI